MLTHYPFKIFRMKKVLVLLIIIYACSPIKAQWFDEPIIELDTIRLQVMYQLTFIEDTNHLDYTRQERHILQTGMYASSYQAYNHLKLYQTGKQKVQEGNLVNWLQSGISSVDYGCRFTYRIYKNHTNGIITYTDRIPLLDHFKYEENCNVFKWVITQDTAIILGFMSQKAYCDFGGRRWEAWFTPDIPYSDGPYKFCGLPGLILKIVDTKGHYKFDVLELELPEQNAMVDYHGFDYITTTKKAFFKVYDDNNKSLINDVKSNGADASSIQRIQKNMQAKNNPIELDRE